MFYREDFVLSVWEERKVRLYGEHTNVHQSHSQKAPVICVMAPPIHLGAWSMLWLPFELLMFMSSIHGQCSIYLKGSLIIEH